MPDKRIRDLPVLDTLADDDALLVSDASEARARNRPKRVPISTIKALVASLLAPLSARQDGFQVDLRTEENLRETNDTNERQARRDADAALDTKISDEATTRSHADTALSDRITTNHNNISQGLSQAGVNLNNERIHRENGDEALDRRVSAIEQGGGGTGTGGGGLTPAQASKLAAQSDNPLSTPAVRTGDWMPLGTSNYQWFPYDEDAYNAVRMSKGDVMVAPPDADGVRRTLIGVQDADLADMLEIFQQLAVAECYISIKAKSGTVGVSGRMLTGTVALARGPYTIELKIQPDAYNAMDVVELDIAVQSAIKKQIDDVFEQISHLATNLVDGRNEIEERLDDLAVPPMLDHPPLSITPRVYYLTQDSVQAGVEQFFSGVPGRSGDAGSPHYYGFSVINNDGDPPLINKQGQNIADVLPAASGIGAVYLRDRMIHLWLRADKGEASAIHVDASASAAPSAVSVIPLIRAAGTTTVSGVDYIRYSAVPGATLRQEALWTNLLTNNRQMHIGIHFGAGDALQYLNRDGTKSVPTIMPAGFYAGIGNKWVKVMKEAFETPVGASPATLPVGSKRLALMFNRGNEYWPGTLLLSQLTVNSREYSFDSHNPSQTEDSKTILADASYNPVTRVLTYAITGGRANSVAIIVEGEA